MTKSKAIVLLVALFLAGAMAGGFVGFNIGKRAMPGSGQVEARKPPPGSWPRPPGRPEKTRDRLTRELALTNEQLTKIDPIIAAFDAQLEAMNKRNWNDVALAISNRNEQIKPFLTPDQLRVLDERHSKWRQSGGGPPRRDFPSHQK